MKVGALVFAVSGLLALVVAGIRIYCDVVPNCGAHAIQPSRAEGKGGRPRTTTCVLGFGGFTLGQLEVAIVLLVDVIRGSRIRRRSAERSPHTKPPERLSRLTWSNASDGPPSTAGARP